MRYVIPGDEPQATTVVAVDDDGAQHFLEKGWREVLLLASSGLPSVFRDRDGHLFVNRVYYTSEKDAVSHRTSAANHLHYLLRETAIADFLEGEAKAKNTERAAKVEKLVALFEKLPPSTSSKEFAAALVDAGVTP